MEDSDLMELNRRLTNNFFEDEVGSSNLQRQQNPAAGSYELVQNIAMLLEKA